MLQEGFPIGKKLNLLALYVDTLDWLLHRLCGGAFSIFPRQITPKLIESSNGGMIEVECRNLGFNEGLFQTFVKSSFCHLNIYGIIVILVPYLHAFL